MLSFSISFQRRFIRRREKTDPMPKVPSGTQSPKIQRRLVPKLPDLALDCRK
jgi:hypothetical protein